MANACFLNRKLFALEETIKKILMEKLQDICRLTSTNVYAQEKELRNIIDRLHLIKKNQTYGNKIRYGFLDIDIQIKSTTIKLKNVRRIIRDIEQQSFQFGG